MIIAWLLDKKLETQEITLENQALLKNAIWIDLISPTQEEELLIEKHLNFNVPTREEMIEIEISSRLYKEDNVLFMTAPMIAHADSDNPKFDPISFVLTPTQLITVRYIEPRSFVVFASYLKKLQHPEVTAVSLLIELLDLNIDRLADILEFIGRCLDDYSKTIFQAEHEHEEKLDYRMLMRQIGSNGDLNTKIRESLISFNRLIAYLEQKINTQINDTERLQITTLHNDIASLSDHAHFLSNKINFLLDGTLGMINIEQNNVIKIFSVAAVIFLPPTLVASIYGMNFHFIPELSWKYGYVFAVILMLLAGWVPYKYFKYRKWL